MYIDGLQYSNWNKEVFEQFAKAGLNAVHVTIAYHESFREMVLNLEAWNERFDRYPEFIIRGESADDVRQAERDGRTAIFIGFQNPSPIEDDIGLIEIVHKLGVRFMQLSYNNQSLLATGCYEADDPGLTRFGRQAVAEMNRVGLAIDMSHSAERSTLEAIEHSARPITISHANPAAWEPALRNKSDAVLAALSESGGILGFSTYPHHLRNKSDCTLADFCEMVAATAEQFGVEMLAIGSDLCQGQPDSIVEWMRNGRWSRVRDYGEGSAALPGFPPQPAFFRDSTGFLQLDAGLSAVGFSADEVAAILGNNWLRFFEQSFGSELVN